MKCSGTPLKLVRNKKLNKQAFPPAVIFELIAFREIITVYSATYMLASPFSTTIIFRRIILGRTFRIKSLVYTK